MGREGTLLPRAPSSPALDTARDAEMKDEVIFGHSQKEGARCGLCALDSLLWAHPGGCHTLTAPENFTSTTYPLLCLLCWWVLVKMQLVLASWLLWAGLMSGKNSSKAPVHVSLCCQTWR